VKPGAVTAPHRLIDRVGPDDLVSLATNWGVAPVQAGAVLVLDVQAELEPSRLVEAIGRQPPAVAGSIQRKQREDMTVNTIDSSTTNHVVGPGEH